MGIKLEDNKFPYSELLYINKLQSIEYICAYLCIFIINICMVLLNNQRHINLKLNKNKIA